MGFFEEFGVRKVGGGEVFAIISRDPLTQFCVKGVVQKHSRVDAFDLVGGENHAQAKTGGAAAVFHALADVHEFYFLDGGVALGEIGQESVRVGIFLGLYGGDEGHAIGADELAVEEIGTDCVGEGEFLFGDLDFVNVAEGRRVEPCAGVMKENIQIADGHDVVVKSAGVDGGGVLLDEVRVR